MISTAWRLAPGDSGMCCSVANVVASLVVGRRAEVECGNRSAKSRSAAGCSTREPIDSAATSFK